jgi:hypothetical protein
MAQEKIKKYKPFCQNIKNSWEGQLFLTESIDNIELDNKNKEILSNNFDRTKYRKRGKLWL